MTVGYPATEEWLKARSEIAVAMAARGITRDGARPSRTGRIVGTKRSDAPMTLEIRSFDITDRENVLTLWADAFPDEPAYNQSERMIARKLRVQPDLFLVAVADGAVAGTVMAGYDGVRGWIHRLAVARTVRRQGVGTALLRAAEARLLALGCPKVNLQVRARNAGVVAFYEAAGYRVEANISMARHIGE